METLSPKDQLALTLFDIGAVKLGKFKLHSGQMSRIYLDLRVLVSFPAALRQATAVYQTLVAPLTYDLLAAAPLAGLPLATALCLATDKPLIYPRKTAKSYGTGKSVEGIWTVGQTAVVVDDLVTSGDSILEAIVSLKAAGLHVNDAVVLVDRQQGGAANLREAGYNLHAAMSLLYLLDVLENHNRITTRQRQRVLESL